MENLSNFNPDQQKAINFIQSFWTSKQLFAILHGAAGTGKTYILKEVAKICYKAVPLFTAPTNEACRQLELSLPLGSKICTTYQALGYAMDTKGEDKKLKQVSKSVTPAIETSNLIIVDEASMLTSELLQALIEIGKQGKKILFVGHKSQLPPIEGRLSIFSEAVSPVFEQEWPIYTLRKSERAQGELLSYLNHLESLIYAKHKIYKKDRWLKNKDDLLDYIHSKEGRDNFKKDIAKVICFSNKEVDKWNQLIRESLHREKNPVRFKKNDRILAIECFNSLGEVDGFSERAILKVLSSTIPQFEKIEANSRMQIKTVTDSSLLGIKCWKIQTTDKQWLYCPVSEEELTNFSKRMLNNIFSKPPNKRDKEFVKYHQIMSCFAKLKHSYAFTTHRSQGMTIPEVWVMWSDIKICQNVVMKHKLLYVAASRAKETMWIVE